MPILAEQSLPYAAGSPPVDRADPSVRESLSGPGFRAFARIADAWGLAVVDRCALLGHINPSTYHKWASGKIATLGYDQLERISLVLGIYKALGILFADAATGPSWLKANNSDAPFGGAAPIAVMTRGGIDGLYRVRRYLDGWRGVWP